ncbi:cytochrome P450 [Actinomadura sp. NAK00032]|uniref:cytochrome P450 n=1 Tax=Actinomadura sp. NAK00032 TaxID=2742128 RepID=UPI00159033E8|nr:cytochrome P450 [Actinomadura sp. NAK00032]QKW35625.1 cytochrome P450 [Actinomadura sp. NAK00032]
MRVEEWAVHPKHIWLHGRRPEQLVDYDESLQMWNVYGYPEAVDILTRPKTYSNDAGRLDPVELPPDICAGDFSQLDPPEHRKVRGLVDFAFTPNLVAGLEGRVDALVHELLDELCGRDAFDLVADFATPLPLTVICELLGVPREDRAIIHDWSRRMVDDTDDFEPPEVIAEQTHELQRAFDMLREMREYWEGLAAERRRSPRDDLLSHLVQVEHEGDRLSDLEVFNIANRLVVNGHHTTSMLIGNTMLILDAFPEQRERVRADRSLVPPMIEESLRFLSPISTVGKVTNEDVVVAGTAIPKDQLVMVWTGAANRDERAFDRPHEFDLTRAPNPHLGFGRGIHFCVGRRLARLEARSAVNILLDRLPGLRADPANPPSFFQIADAGGLDGFPVLVK